MNYWMEEYIRSEEKEALKEFNMSKKFIEPKLLKAGSNLVSLGIMKRPPKVDYRVIAEEG